MDNTTLLLVALALGTDAFSVAVGLGVAGIRNLEAIIISVTVALFHVVMPLTGLYLGMFLGEVLGQVANFLGAAVLLFIGAGMFRQGFRGRGHQGMLVALPKRLASTGASLAPARGIWGVVVLAGSVSLDALSVGFTMGTQNVRLLVTVLVMGTIAGIMTAAGFGIGRRIGAWLGERAQMIGGLILMAIAGRLFFQLLR